MTDEKQLEVGDILYVKTPFTLAKNKINRVTSKRAFSENTTFHRDFSYGGYKVVNGDYNKGQLETKELKCDYQEMVLHHKVDKFFREQITQDQKVKAYLFLHKD